MKKNLFSLAIMAMLLCPGIGLAQAPHQVGGFVLGKDIAEYRKMVNMDTALPIRHSQFIEEVETRDLAGFKSGLIAYGACAAPGKILRIKLKYADSSKKFYEALLKRFKQRFGEPNEWRGDPFHILLAWKWAFTDANNNRISLILQHNTRDTEEKMGNAVKLTLTSQVEKERLCYNNRHPQSRKARKKKENKKNRGPVDWERFIPR